MLHKSFILTKKKYKGYLLVLHLLRCLCFRITKVTSPILILHAEDDSVIPYQLGQQVPPDPALCVCVCVCVCVYVCVCLMPQVLLFIYCFVLKRPVMELEEMSQKLKV